MSNRLLIAIVAILVAVSAVVVILAYTYLDVGLGPKSGGELRVALSSLSAETLDPSLDNADGLKYHGHAYDFLVGVDGEGRLDTRYGLLSKWQASPTADSFMLTLRNNALWHDVEPVTAGDVRASLDYYFREDATCGICGAVKGAVAAVEVIDNENVVIQLNAPDVVFPGLLAAVESDLPLLPAHIVNNDPAALQGAPVGSGPWRYATRAQGQSVLFEKNSDYWNAGRISPFDALSISLVPEEPARIALIETDKIDVAPIDVASIEQAKSNGFTIYGPKHVVSTALRFFMSYDDAF